MLQMFTLVVLFGLLLPCVISEGINTRVEGDVLLEKRVDAFLSRFVGVTGKYPQPARRFPPSSPLVIPTSDPDLPLCAVHLLPWMFPPSRSTR